MRRHASPRLVVLSACLLAASVSAAAPPAEELPPLNRAVLQGARQWIERAPRHAGIVSDIRLGSGVPHIIDSHRDGGGVSERFLLTHWGAILAHFRLVDAPS